MSTTLVLGAPSAGRSRYAQSLLGSHSHVRVITAHAESDVSTTLPDAWSVTHTTDWQRALMTARTPVLIGPVDGWLTGALIRFDSNPPSGGPMQSEQRLIRTSLHNQLDEWMVTMMYLPYDVVVVGSEDLSTRGPGTAFRRELLGEVNARLSAGADRVHAVLAGRVLDLTHAPRVPSIPRD